MTAPQQFLIYQSEDGSTRINVMLEAERLMDKAEKFGHHYSGLAAPRNSPQAVRFVRFAEYLFLLDSDLRRNDGLIDNLG